MMVLFDKDRVRDLSIRIHESLQDNASHLIEIKRSGEYSEEQWELQDLITWTIHEWVKDMKKGGH